MINKKIADIFYEVAKLLELQGHTFRSRAYQKAARTIDSMKKDILTYYEEGTLRDIEGIGKALEEKISEIIETGSLEYLDNLKEEIPEGLLDIMRVPGIGPNKAKQMYEELDITDLTELKTAVEEKRIRELEGFGAKTEEKILNGINMLDKVSGRHLMNEIVPLADELIELLESAAERLEKAGSLRRWKETIGDIDILTTGEPHEIMDAFVSHPNINEVLMRGDTKTSILFENGIQADLRVVEKENFGAALQYFTGSKEHNVKVRQIAIEKGYKLNEYGLFEEKKAVAGESEEGIYEALGMNWIPPELREDRGEIDASKEGKLPELITLEDIKGDLQMHSNWSDGQNTIMEMAEEAQDMGYDYIAITDHTQSLSVAGGLNEEEVVSRQEEIDQANKELDLTVLAGMEVDILKDGSLDLQTDTLEHLDLVLAAVHSNFSLSSEVQTERIIDAFSTGLVDIFAHPTGKKIGEREPYEINLTKVIDAAVDYDVALEINAFPQRLDLDSLDAREAMERGVTISLGTDAHGLQHLHFMKYGVGVARRAWLEKENLLNTKGIDDLMKYIGVE
ncbi:MAG: DNA polymerase/3'-5' exonuclease PolX [Thermoplasmata archaeon]